MKRAIILALTLIACGQETPPQKLEIKPSRVTIAPSATTQFHAVTDTTVTWSVRETGGGTITQSGLYTAPSTQGTFHVEARNAVAVGEATVEVDSGVRITATSPVSTDACIPVQLSATVTGSTDTLVLWTVIDPECGVIDAAGQFTSARGNGDCTIQAQAHADPSRVAFVIVNVTERVLGVAVSPASVQLNVNGTQQFNATVTTTCGTFASGT